MNCSPAQPTLVVSHSLAERIGGGVGEALQAAFSAIERVWRDHKGRSDELRTFDSVAHLNEHVLKDIGAPHWLVSQAAARREAEHRPWIDIELR